MEIKIDTFTVVTHGVESADNFEIEIVRQKEVRSRFRGTFPYIFNRGNELKTISFSMVKELPSHPQAVAWMLDLSSRLPAAPQLATITAHNGAETVVRRFKLAQVPSVRMRQIGCSVVHEYRLIGTEITKPATIVTT